ncbi:GAF and ANTAR domain-containing protein [Paractinoplanes rishiriensis]|uniref:ANTAR domain-containing protein n=1 Tax=Paractinoplanes rishiriensis TaxID=1050105 RepID=A0A919K2Y0_9ACTN|nr:GAF and ANTAR domain-containing protein [Actinoplanes rishiriensis]GIE99253.1 hypothetical protein Ari01nite_67180 [Actinoplanes rishiriensis]
MHPFDDITVRETGRGGQGQPSLSFTGDVTTNQLAETLSELARSLQTEASLPDTLGGIVAAAVHTVPGAEHAGITEVRERRKLVTHAATAEVVRDVDRAQYETGQGPCVESVYAEKTLRLDDMVDEPRWPAFCRLALGLGVRSMLSFQLYVVGDNLGALNLYASNPDAFTDESEYVGLLFASHAAIAMVGAQREQDLDRALAMRDVIGQAKGVLMERYGINAEQAFSLLAQASQRTNTKLTELARRLSETGRMSGDGQLKESGK